METILIPLSWRRGGGFHSPRGPEGFGGRRGIAEKTGACAALCSAFADVFAEHGPVCSVRLRSQRGSVTRIILRRTLRKDRTNCYYTRGMLHGI
jgi:hypothetical protein